MYALLTRQNLVPRAPVPFAPELLVPGFYAIDLETRGLAAEDPDSAIVGIGIANEKHCFYVDLTQGEPAGLREFLLTSTFTAFNIIFDGAHLQKLTGQWLNFVGCSYGLFKQLGNDGFLGQSWALERLQLDVLGWRSTNKDALNAALVERKLSKADLWRLPAEILAPYCASDADAAWQGWAHLSRVAAQFPTVLDYHTRLFLTEVRLLVEQQFRGIQVDQSRLESCRVANEQAIQTSMTAFLGHPQVAPHVAAYNKEVRDTWLKDEPPHHTKAGDLSIRWQSWMARDPERTGIGYFNANSKPQLGWLFYDRMGLRALKKTETGRRVVDRKVLPSLGEPGKLLTEYNVYLKRRGYIEATVAKAARDGCIHPQFNSAGTITGRLGGSGGWNAQQMPKNREFLQALAARPGHKLVQFDFAALEPMLLAEFSQDPTLLALYGPAAKPNDVYLYLLAKISALAGDIRAYYDPDNPTQESIAKAKKLFKHQRGIAKKCKLSYDYGAGVAKMHETLVLDGIDISWAEVRSIRADMDRLFAGIRRFDLQLQSMWQANGGWIPNVLGRPICVAEQYIKDIVNRMIQSSGHDVLQLFIWNLDRLRVEQGLGWAPWIMDLHDETIVECPEADAAAVAQSFTDALAATNTELGMGIQLKGEPQVADSLADIKIE